MSKSKYQKYKSTLTGTIIYLIGMASLVVISSLNVYIASYIHIKQEWVTIHYGLFLQPIFIFSMAIANPIGGLIENKIGFYYALILGNIICLIGIFGLYLTQNIWLCYFFFLIIGFSCFSLNIPLKNITFYVPEKKGFIGAVISVVLQISASIYGFLGEFIINKEGYSLKKEDKFYPDYIANNISKFYYIPIICVPFFTVFSFLFIYIYDPSFENENENIPLNDGSINALTNPIISSESNIPTNNEKDENDEEKKKKEDEKYKKDIKKAIKSKQFWLLCGIAFCIGFLIRFVSITFRTFGALIGIDGNAFKYLGFAITFSTLISTPIWGCLVDKYGTKIILKITCAGCTILGVILYFSVNNNLFYLLCISISMINISGFSASINPHIMEIFTIKYTLEIGGLIGFFSGLNSIICSILSFIVSFYYTTGEELKTPYKVIYIIGTILSGIGFILNYYESGEKFNFDDNNDKKESEEQKIVL